jgi:hypothetical protein
MFWMMRKVVSKLVLLRCFHCSYGEIGNCPKYVHLECYSELQLYREQAA